MQEIGYEVVGTDINDGTDFLKTIRAVDYIVTNPPWGRMDEWINHAKKCARKSIAFLLELRALTGVARYSIFQDQRFHSRQSLRVFPGRLPLTYQTAKRVRQSTAERYARN